MIRSCLVGGGETWWRRLGLGALALLAAGCGSENTFACTEDSSCSNGWCEPNGYCSFPDDDCGTGRRYGDFSGPFSGQCVSSEGDTEAGSSTSSGTGSGGSTEPMLSTGPEPTITDDESGTSSNTGDPVCGRSEFCAAVPSDPWMGPVRLGRAEDGCEGTPVFEGFEDYDGEWSCSCSCDVDAPPSCGGSGVDLELFDNESCDGDPIATEDVSSRCSSLDFLGEYHVRPTTEQPAACEANPSLIASAVTPQGGRVACEVDVGSVCDGGSCYDAEQTLCVFAEGETACPEGDFRQRSVVYRDYVDDRGCGGCGCEGSYSCGGAVRVHTSDSSCNGPSVSVSMGACSGAPLTVSAAEIVVLDISSTTACEVSGGEEIGEVTPTIPVTVCCRSPG